MATLAQSRDLPAKKVAQKKAQAGFAYAVDAGNSKGTSTGLNTSPNNSNNTAPLNGYSYVAPSYQVQTPVTPDAAAVNTTPQDVPPPFLTPDQAAALRQSWLKDKQTIVDDTALETQAKGTYDQSTAVNAQNKLNALDQNSQSMAARGMFQSSINDASIADIGATYAANQFNYDTAYNTSMLKYGSEIGSANTDIGTLTDQYTGDAIQNAQAQLPSYQPGQPMPTTLNTTFDINSLLPTAPTAVTPGTLPAAAAANGVGAAGSSATAANASSTVNPLIASSQTNPMAGVAKAKVGG